VESEHLGVVHLVDVVARQHHDVARGLAHDGIEVLEDGVGRAEVPVLTHALLGRQHLDELAQLFRHHVPSHADMAVERERLVLSGDEDAPEPRVDAVAQREVDDPVGPAEIDRRFGSFRGERVQPFAGTSCEQDHENVVQSHGGSSIIAPGRPGASQKVNPCAYLQALRSIDLPGSPCL
jgi:hypothetical protein